MSSVLLGVVVAPGAGAGCVGPAIAIGEEVDDGPSARAGVAFGPGQVVTVSGVRFRQGCTDVVLGGGCVAARSGPDLGSPLTDVELKLTQGRKSWVLGKGDASALSAGFSIRWNVRIPRDVETGPAELRATSVALPIRIRA